MATWRILSIDNTPVVKTVAARRSRRSDENPIAAVGRAFVEQRKAKPTGGGPSSGDSNGRRFRMQAGGRAAIEKQRERQRELEADLDLSAADRIAGFAARDTGGSSGAVIVDGLPGGSRSLRSGPGIEKAETKRPSFENILRQPAWNGTGHNEP